MQVHWRLTEIFDPYTQTDLSSSENVIPDWGSPKVDVEVCEAALNTHKTVPEYRRDDKTYGL